MNRTRRPSSIRRTAALLPVLIVMLLHSPAPGTGPGVSGDEEARESAENSGIMQQIAVSEYHVTKQGRTERAGVIAAWQAPNRAHNLRTFFLDKGIRVIPRREQEEPAWEWGLSLIGYGRGAQIAPVEQPVLLPEAARIEYARGRVDEWYVNEPRGLEQGFTLKAPPEAAATGKLIPGARRQAAGDAESGSPAYLVLTLQGGLTARLSPDGQAIDFAPRSGGMTVLHYGKLEVRDATGRLLPSWMEGFAEAGVRGIRLVFDDTNAVYPVTVDPLLTSPAWTAEGDQAGAQLGFAVSPAGDVNGDGFDDVIVGAPYYDGGQVDEGRVLLYLGSASGLEESPAWTAEGNQAGAELGYSVSTAGNVNGDAHPDTGLDLDDVIVGSPGFDFDDADDVVEGRAWVYHGSPDGLVSTTWNYRITLTEPDDKARFGAAVAGAGDVDGNGFDDVLVGAPHGVDTDEHEGMAFVFPGSGDGLSETPSWSAAGDSDADEFGRRLASGDVNGDGYSDVLVSAPHHLSKRGIVHLYYGTDQGLSDTEPRSGLPWTREGWGDWSVFGLGLSAADLNGDGYDDVIIGAPYDDADLDDEGRVYVFQGALFGPGPSYDWIAEGDQEAALFGWSVSGAGDVNGDGYEDLIVGARLHDNGGTDEGRAYLYTGSPTALAPGQAYAWVAEGDQFGAWFGYAVAGAGDVNGDGYDDLLVGAPRYARGQDNEGSAFVYHGAARVTGWMLADHLGFAALEIGSASWEVQSNALSLANQATPGAVTYGPVPQSVLVTTGRAMEKDPGGTYPEKFTGIADVDWGDNDLQGDTTVFELDLNVPAWAGTLRFTTQFLTNEEGDDAGGDPFDTDTATVGFYLNGWSVDDYPLNDPVTWVVNSPISHCINVTGGQQIKLVFTVEDTDGSEDSGVVLSRIFFSRLAFPSDITLEHDGVDGNGDGLVDYFANPAPHDVSLTSGTYTYSKSLLSLPGIGLPFQLSIVYNSQGDREGNLGRKWTHSYGGHVRKMWTGDGTTGHPYELEGVLVRHGAGTTEYFKANPVTGGSPYEPKYPGSHSTLTELCDPWCLAGGRPGDMTLVTKDHLTYQFTEHGDETPVKLLKTVTDPHGNSFTVNYADQDGKKVDSVVDTRGHTIDFVYTNNRLTSVEYDWAATTSKVSFSYDAATGDLASFTDLGGYTTTFTYDATGNLLTVTDADGVTQVANSYEQFQSIHLLQVGDRVLSRRGAGDPDPFDPEAGIAYDYDGEAMRQTDRLGHRDTRLYDVKGRLARRIDPAGVQLDFEFDRHGNTTESRRTLPSESWPEVMSAASYDDSGNLLSRTDFPGTCLGGPSMGEACTSDSGCPSSSCSTHESMSYDAYDNLASTTDHFGNTTTFTYDARHSLLSATDPLGTTVRHTYMPDGRAASTIDARGSVYTCEYDDPLSQPTKVYNPVDADGNGVLDHVTYTYDALGRTVAITDPNGNTSVSEYDDAGRLLTQTDPVGNTSEYTYDPAGRPLTSRDARGATTSNVYTPTGRLQETTDPAGTTSYEYDDQGRLVTMTDPLGRTVSYGYDALGRITRVTACDAAGTSCVHAEAEFDEVGNTARIIDPKGNAVVYEYDRLGRVIRATDELGNTWTYTHDGRGALASQTNARGQTVTYEYDDASRPTAMYLAGGSVRHALDPSGNPLASVSNVYASVARAFDEMDRPVERTDEFGNTIRYTYDAAGNLRSLTYSDGSMVFYSYDALNRLARLEDWFDPANPPPASIDVGDCETSADCRVTAYGYDEAGNPTSSALPDGSTVTLAYDLAGRLIHLSDRNGDAGVIFAANYTVDAGGLRNAAYLTLPLEPGVEEEAVHDYSYNELNQLTSRDGDAYTYDADGNLTGGVLGGIPASLSYDEMNQLVRINGDTFRYDTDGLRVEATRGGVTRRYVYDPGAAYPQLLEEHDENGNLIARYVHGLGLVSRQGPGGQDYRVYHYDSRGSTLALTDSDGAITDTYAYGAYGRLIGYENPSGDPTPNPFRYNGRDGVMDDGNGLYYMRARHYAPELMRFIQQDVAPAGLSDTQTLNRYAFVRGNPIQFVDPDGNWLGIDDAIAIVGGAIAGAVSQAIECGIASGGSFKGEGCGWEDYVGAAAGGAAWGATMLYTGSPVAAGAAGGLVDSLATQGLKAIPGGKEPLSAEDFWMDLGTQVVVGAACGVGGKGLGKMTGKVRVDRKLLWKNAGRMGQMPKAMQKSLLKETWGDVGIRAGLQAAGGWLKGNDYFGIFGESGGGPPGRGTAPPGNVWNQYSSPQSDAWAGAASRGCIAWAWR